MKNSRLEQLREQCRVSRQLTEQARIKYIFAKIYLQCREFDRQREKCNRKFA